MASGEEPPRNQTTPELNYQTWDEFHSHNNNLTKSSIDILLSRPPELEISTENGAELVTESAEMPERIRVNSGSIIQFLSKLCPTSHSKNSPIIMFRPYKTLIYFDQEIRRSAMELDEHAESTTAKELRSTLPSDDEDAVQRSQLRCLIQFMDIHLSTRATFLQGPKCNTIFFSDLWLFYKPGDTVVNFDLRQAYRIIKAETKRKIAKTHSKFIVEEESFEISCVCIDFDGQWLGPVLKKVVMKKWELSKPVESLALIPLIRAETQRKHLRHDLIRRGKTFIHVASVSPMHYSGYTLDTHLEVNATIIVDFEEALRSEVKNEETFVYWKTTVKDVAEVCLSTAGVDDYVDEDRTGSSKDENIYNDSFVDDYRHTKFIVNHSIVAGSGEKVLPITICPQLLNQVGTLAEDEFLIMSFRVFGFTMDTAQWGEYSNLP